MPERHAGRAPGLRHRVEYAAVAAVAALVRRLPEPLAAGVGRGLGLAFYLADGPHRRLATANLQRAFPSRTDAECRAMARATFVHFGRLLVEFLRFAALPPARMLERVELEGFERVEQAHRAGRGVLFVTGHFGFWELHALAHAAARAPIAVVARSLDNPHLDALLERLRGATGNTVIERRGGLRRILRTLQQNQGVAILIDQHIQTSDAVTVEFFDRPVSATSAVAVLAIRTGAPVVPVFALPRSGGGYRLIYEHPIEPPTDPEAPDAIRALTQRCTDVLEMYVRRYPQLWLWMHRRWRDGDPAAAGVPGMFPAAARDDPPDPRVEA